MRPEVTLYKIYIDDMVIVWRGSKNSWKNFLEEINNNVYDVSFTGGWDYNQMNFLDLVLYKQADQHYTCTYFKEMDLSG